MHFGICGPITRGWHRRMAEQTQFTAVAQKRWPSLPIAGTGCFAVQLCSSVQLCQTPIESMVVRRASCGPSCTGINWHRIVELKPATAPARRYFRNIGLLERD